MPRIRSAESGPLIELPTGGSSAQTITFSTSTLTASTIELTGIGSQLVVEDASNGDEFVLWWSGSIAYDLPEATDLVITAQMLQPDGVTWDEGGGGYVQKVGSSDAIREYVSFMKTYVVSGNGEVRFRLAFTNSSVNDASIDTVSAMSILPTVITPP